MVAFYQLQYGRYSEGEITAKELASICWNYTKFLLQPLELWMFVPCDEEGNFLEDPCTHNRRCADICQGSCGSNDYEQDKERVLFEGFTMFGNNNIEFRKLGEKILCIHVSDLENCSFENLVQFNLTLTQAAQDKIQL